MIRVSKSSISQLEIDTVIEVLKKEFLGMGEEVMKFEKELQTFLGDENSLVTCVSSGTAALHLALEALNLPEGSEVLVPSLTYVSSFQSIQASRLKPIACDVRLTDGYIDLEDAEKRLTSKTKVLMPVHYASNCSRIKEVYKFADSHGLRVVEDAAHALGSTFENKLIGTFGDIICFSFDGIKNITSGEGGAIVTKDQALTDRIKDMRLLGVKNDTEKRYKGSRSWEFDVESLGYRYHMSNIMAAIGRAQLNRFPSFISRRKKIVSTYLESLGDIDEINLFQFDYKNSVPHIFPVKVSGHRDALRAYLFENGIETGIHYKPNHKLKKFNDGQPRVVAEKLAEELITLPLHYDLSDDDLLFIIENLRKFFRSL